MFKISILLIVTATATFGCQPAPVPLLPSATSSATGSPILAATATVTPAATRTATHKIEVNIPTSDFYIDSKEDLLYIKDFALKDPKLSQVLRGFEIACTHYGASDYMVIPMIFRNAVENQAQVTPQAPDATYVTALRQRIKNYLADCIDPQQIINKSYANHIKREYGTPDDSVVIGLVIGARSLDGFGFLKPAALLFTTGTFIALITNDNIGGISQYKDPIITQYEIHNWQFTQAIQQFESTGDASGLDGSPVEIELYK